MNNYYLGKRSRERLRGVHRDLIIVVSTAIQITGIDFMVGEGLRSKARQAHLVEIGASHTMNSRHLTGHAVDLWAYADGKVHWDWPLYDLIAEAMKEASAITHIPIEWGGDWKSFKDGPHFQLPRSIYG